MVRVFEVEITETLQRKVKVEALNEEEALDIAREMYNDEDIVLDYEDHVKTDFEVIK